MLSKVYFVPRRANSHKESLPKKVKILFEKASFAKIIEKDEKVAVKLHFGEKGGTAFIHPVLVRQVLDKIKEENSLPFLTDTNTLYAGKRANSIDHLQTAVENGFSFATMQTPIIIADGLIGRSFQEVEIGLKHFEQVKIADEIIYADAMLVLSHVKGHMLTGFAGALKNLGMGCGSRGGKQMMHSTVKPKVGDECVLCGYCLNWCLTEAITLAEKKVVIDSAKCTGCGECTVTCPEKAIKIRWKSETSDVMERMIEFAYGAVKNKKGKVGYINFCLNVTPDCDCASWSDAPIVSDVGILASLDPVAIDQASLDLINKQQGLYGTRLKNSFKSGEDKFKDIFPEIDSSIQLAYAEKIGLGNRKYELIVI